MHASFLRPSTLFIGIIATFAVLALPARGQGHRHLQARLAHQGRRQMRHSALLSVPTLRFDSVRSLSRYLAQIHAQEQRMPPGPRAESGREDGPDWLDAYLFYLRQRAFPHDSVDWSAYGRAVEHRDRMPGSGGSGDTLGIAAVTGRWEFVGPQNLAVPYQQYYGSGPLSGRINACAFDPSSQATYYVCAAGGGLWKTLDGGSTWNSLSDGTAWKYQQATSIVIDPTNSLTLYVATGDSVFFGAFAGRFIGNGILLSGDGGITWKPLKTPFGKVGISKILLDPDNPQLLTVATGSLGFNNTATGSLWRSADKGVTWKRAAVPVARWTDVVAGAADATGARSYFATGYNDANSGLAPFVVYQSKDRGLHWQALVPPLSNTPQNGLDIACSVLDANTVYLLSGQDTKLFKSTDAGATWTDITGNFPLGALNAKTQRYYNFSQWEYDYTLACSKRQDAYGSWVDVVYVGLIDLVQSPDGGANWRSIGGPTYDANNALLHNDQHSLAVDPRDPNHLLVGNDGGVFSLSYVPASPPTQDTWSYTSLNAGLGVTQFYKMDVDTNDKDMLLGGAQDNASPVASGDLTHWNNVVGGDGGWCAVDPDTPLVQYATSQFLHIDRTIDAWASWSLGNPGDISPNYGKESVAFLAPIALDTCNPHLLYAATSYLYSYNTDTSTWTADLGGQRLCGPQTDPNVNYPYVICMTAACPAGHVYTGSIDGQIWMTENGGLTWKELDNQGASLPVAAVTSISVDTLNPNSILVGLSGSGHAHLWRCADTTATSPVWSSASGTGASSLPDISLNAIAVDPGDPEHSFYVATDVGVFSTSNAGGTWRNATHSLGLPTAQVNDLKVDGQNGYLYAATFGRGIWRISIGAPTAYDLIDLGPLIIGGINDCGEVVGAAGAADGTDHAYLWTDPASGMKDLGSIGNQGVVSGINHLEALCGTLLAPNPPQHDRDEAFLFTSGTITQLGDMGTENGSIAYGINDYGQVTGTVDAPPTGGSNTGFLWTPTSPHFTTGSMIRLPGLEYLDSYSAAYAINAMGQVVGESTFTGGAYNHAVLWTPSSPNSTSLTIADLGALSATSGSRANAINKAGVVVGYSSKGASQPNQHAFVWTPAVPNGSTGTMVDLGTLGGSGTYSYASSINSQGDIVGYASGTQAGVSGAVIWQALPGGGHRIRALNKLVPTSSGLILMDAVAINDRGQIIGHANAGAGSIDVYLLTPR